MTVNVHNKVMFRFNIHVLLILRVMALGQGNDTSLLYETFLTVLTRQISPSNNVFTMCECDLELEI